MPTDLGSSWSDFQRNRIPIIQSGDVMKMIRSQIANEVHNQKEEFSFNLGVPQ